MSTLVGAEAVEAVLESGDQEEPLVIGIQGNSITRTPLSECLHVTWSVADAIREQDYDQALMLRGGSFKLSFDMLRTLVRTFPHDPEPGKRRLRIGVMHGGGPAPGMNTALRAAIRLGTDKGHVMLGIHSGFRGLIDGDLEELDWMSVAGLAPRGGAELGTNRYIPEGRDFYTIARNLEENQIEGLLLIGGWAGYLSILELYKQRQNYPAFDIPMVCLPASINNNLPATDYSVGSDTALHSIVWAVDKIKQSAVASQRVFVVEVMGHHCGYLTLMGAMATGAERAYLHEEGVTLNDMAKDVRELSDGFIAGKRLGLLIRNELANEVYDTAFMAALFEEEGGDLFDVRQAILGHMQQGGDPTPFDRILATRFAAKSIDYLEEQITAPEYTSACIGQVEGKIKFTSLFEVPRLLDISHARPKKQWWMRLRQIARVMAQPEPGWNRTHRPDRVGKTN
jgi:6-phosphofructokinase 1